MGCITGFVAKIFLMAFNVAVAVVGLVVLVLSSISTAYLYNYGPLIPNQPIDVLIGLQSTSTMVMCLGIFGVLVACCCTNKLFLYTHFILGVCLVITVLTFSGIGASNLNKDIYQNETRILMAKDIATFKVTDQANAYETEMNEIYHSNECCGILSYKDWPKTVQGLPDGCCKSNHDCSYKSELDDLFYTGCYTKIEDDMGDIIAACFKLAIFFGVLLFALLTSTCLCVKCTNAMPI